MDKSKWMKISFIKVYTSVDLAWHGWLFRDTYFMLFSDLQANNLQKLTIVQTLSNPIYVVIFN